MCACYTTYGNHRCVGAVCAGRSRLAKLGRGEGKSSCRSNSEPTRESTRTCMHYVLSCYVFSLVTVNKLGKEKGGALCCNNTCLANAYIVSWQ